MVLGDLLTFIWPHSGFQELEFSIMLKESVFHPPGQKARNRTDHRQQDCEGRNDDENEALDQSREPEGQVALPKRCARLVKALSFGSERKIVVFVDREFTASLKDPRIVVDLRNGFEKKVSQGGMKGV